MGKSVLRDKSYGFAVRVVGVCKGLRERKGEYVLSKQLLRSGTAVGALVREAEFAESRRDFVSKLQVALKEANETVYWLELLRDTGYLEEGEFVGLRGVCGELVAMLVASVKKVREGFK